jgi:Secretion system C-terminal sorting domain
MKIYLLFLFIAVISHSAYAQAPAMQWQKSLGGTGDDEANSILQTSDGGYIVAGKSTSIDGDVTGNHGLSDYWIVKLSSSGSIQWQKSFGGSADDYASSIKQTSDGGYIVAGSSNSVDGDVTGNHGGKDFWVLKLSSTGSLQWEKSLGGSNDEEAQSIQQTPDGGYIVAGYTLSNDGDVSGNNGYKDAWIVKLNDTGGILWQKAVGSPGPEYANSIQLTSDGGYIFAGYNYVLTFHNYWIVKLNDTGGIQWQKSLGGTLDDYANSVQQTSDGGYIVAGAANSYDGDVTGNHGDNDFWIIKLSSLGGIQWQKCYGGSMDDRAYAIQQTIDNGYIVAGYSNSNNGDVSGTHGGAYDYWVIKLSSSGVKQWQKPLGGNDDDQAFSIQQTSDDGYIMAGYSKSIDEDVSGNHGAKDYWIVKLAGNVSVKSINNSNIISIFPNPASDNISINGVGLINIKAYNTLGQLIKEANHADNISISEFPAGMYFIKLFNETGEMIYVDKVIKQ